LDDGTRVTLAPQTTLIVGQDFNRGTRTVTLDGEAFFDVSSRLDAPLIVRTGELTTRVLGTRFDVRRYAQDRMAQIVVTEGKVVVSGFREQETTSRHEASSPERTVVLAAGMMGRVTDTTTAVTTVPDVTDYTRWTQGMMVFRRTPLPEVLATIGHWYGLTFRLADSTLAEQHLTATFDHRSLDDILATIGVLLDVSMTADSTNVITLHAGRRSRSAAPTRNVPDARLSPYKEIGR
jgi:ferric-dicitrate binding protein FerR (iron transport regulator)